MLTTNKALRILKVAVENNPELIRERNEFGHMYEIVNENIFSVTIENTTPVITIGNYVTSALFNQFIDEYLEDKGINVNEYHEDITEAFALLHEIGHVYHGAGYLQKDEKTKAEYDAYYNRENRTKRDDFFLYRKIHNEAVADNFAIETIKTYKKEIEQILNEDDENEDSIVWL